MLLIGYAYQTGRALQAWRTNVTLWENAVAQAPFKVRPRVNLAHALMAAGRQSEGLTEAALARGLLEAGDLHAWDRVDAEHALAMIVGPDRLNGP